MDIQRIETPWMTSYDWKKQYEENGFQYHSLDGLYFVQDAAYVLKMADIDALEDATAEVDAMCLELVYECVKNGDYTGYNYTNEEIALIEDSWCIGQQDQRPSMSIFGRYDFLPGADGKWKMLEYNSDTPTGLPEASVAQWLWLENYVRIKDGREQCPIPGEFDQYNSIHEELIKVWSEMFYNVHPSKTNLMFCAQGSYEENLEDWGNIYYMMDVAFQAGFNVSEMSLEDIHWDGDKFVAIDDTPIHTLFKLYPWEMLTKDEYAQHLKGGWNQGPMNIIQPAWRMLLSHKNTLARLWAKFPKHPNLLPSFTTFQPKGKWVRKPMLAREGWNVSFIEDAMVGVPQATSEFYGENQRYVFQERVMAPKFGDRFPVFGSWVVGNTPCGLGVREEINKEITTNTGLFVPHLILD